MFRSGLERGHNEAIPAGIKTPDCWGQQNLAHHLILSHVNASLTCRDRAKRKKTLCAPREPQKVLVVELLLLYPMYRMPLRGTPCCRPHRTI